MLQDLFNNLKAEWEKLHTASNTWIALLESKYSKGSDAATKAVRESLSNSRFLLTTTDQQMQQANPDTNAGTRDVATKVQSYLDSTASIHQDLVQRSQGEPQAEEYANSTQNARGAVSEQIKAIHEATSVHVMSSTLPGASPLPERVSAAAVPTSVSSLAGGTALIGSVPSVGTSTGGGGTTSNLFLDTMTCLVGKGVKGLPPITQGDVTSTHKLFFGEGSFELTDDQLDHLTQSWSTVVGVFFDPSKFPADGTTDCLTLFAKITTKDLLQQEAHLFTIHDYLESLYDKLEARVIHPTEIVTANI
jgi:hypothetical protein